MAIASHSSSLRTRPGPQPVDQDPGATAQRLAEHHDLVETEMVEHRPPRRSRRPRTRSPRTGVGASLVPWPRRSIPITRCSAAERPGQRVEHPGAEPVRVEQHQRRAVTTPVEGADGEPVVLDRPPSRVLPGRSCRAVARYPGTRTGLRLAERLRTRWVSCASMPTAAGSRLRCEQCETEIIVVKGTDGEVSCCGQPMAAREG